MTLPSKIYSNKSFRSIIDGGNACCHAVQCFSVFPIARGLIDLRNMNFCHQYLNKSDSTLQKKKSSVSSKY